MLGSSKERDKSVAETEAKPGQVPRGVRAYINTDAGERGEGVLSDLHTGLVLYAATIHKDRCVAQRSLCRVPATSWSRPGISATVGTV